MPTVTYDPNNDMRAVRKKVFAGDIAAAWHYIRLAMRYRDVEAVFVASALLSNPNQTREIEGHPIPIRDINNAERVRQTRNPLLPNKKALPYIVECAEVSFTAFTREPVISDFATERVRERLQTIADDLEAEEAWGDDW